MKKIKKYKIQNKMIAKWFNYSTEFSFANSSSAKDVKNGIEKLIEYVENCITEEIKPFKYNHTTPCLSGITLYD